MAGSLYVDYDYVASGYFVEAAGVTTEVQRLDPSGRVVLYELDTTALGGAIYRFHDGRNAVNGNVVWNGQTYTAYPIEATGFEVTGKGTLPRPVLRVSNVGGAITAMMMLYQDLAGCKVTRIKTMVKFLDAVNFVSGVNPTADPTAEYRRDVYIVDRRANEDRDVVELELVSNIDLAGVMFPSRQIIQNYCPWVYRGAECGYTGTNYRDTNDAVVGSLALDVCGKRLSSCRARFGQYAELPYGGFPSVGMTRL